MTDIQAVKQDVDLVGVIETDIGPAVMRGRRPFWVCPFHDDHDPSLTVYNDDDGDRWRCFGCEAHGDLYDWLQRRQGVGIREAVEYLGADVTHVAGGGPKRRPVPPPTSTREAPDDDWQTRASRVVLDCEKELWAPGGTRALAWLADRGLRPATLRRWYVGFNPEAGRLHGIYVHRGVTIPTWHEAANTLWNITIRQAEGGYKQAVGGRRGLFGADTLTEHETAVICEGEFDTMLLWQEAGDLVATVGLPASDQNIGAWLPWLLHARRLLVATDTDQAGHEAAKRWLQLTQRARRLTPPVEPPDGKDITDFYLAGGDLRAWVSEAISCIH